MLDFLKKNCGTFFLGTVMLIVFELIILFFIFLSFGIMDWNLGIYSI
jgi:hypothetical protein